MARFLNTKVLLFALLLLVAIFESTSACGRRHRPYRRRYYYTTTTPRYYGKRSIDKSDQFLQSSEESYEILNVIDAEGLLKHKQKDNFLNNQKNVISKVPKPIRAQRRAEEITESLPPLKTSCGKVLCGHSPNYPTDEIAKVVNEALKRLQSGLSRVVFENRGIDKHTFISKVLDKHSILHDSNQPHIVSRKLVYPTEGYSRKHDQFYYIINIPGFHQGVNVDDCNDGNAFRTGPRYQAYSEEKMVVLPINQTTFTIQDLKIRRILVPHDCPPRVD